MRSVLANEYEVASVPGTVFSKSTTVSNLFWVTSVGLGTLVSPSRRHPTNDDEDERYSLESRILTRLLLLYDIDYMKRNLLLESMGQHFSS
jgi:hypothetical protein